MNYLRGSDGNCFNDDNQQEFLFIFTLTIFSYIIYIYLEGKLI